MSAADPRPVELLPTGGAVWAVPGSSLYILWGGPGAGLRLGDVYTPGGFSTSIDHPAASGSFDTYKAARAAVGRFLALGGADQ